MKAELSSIGVGGAATIEIGGGLNIGGAPPGNLGRIMGPPGACGRIPGIPGLGPPGMLPVGGILGPPIGAPLGAI